MDVRHLKHLVALAEERHFARAAKRVHLSQPALSRSIMALEAEVGTPLFDRGIKEAEPTPIGAFLIERAKRLLFDVRALEHDLAQFRHASIGDTTFGVGPFAAATLVPDLLVELRRRYPHVCLTVEVAASRVLCERLLLEALEFFVADVRELAPDPRLDIALLGQQVGRFYVRAGHPLAGQSPALRVLWDYGVISVTLPRQIKAFFARTLGVTTAPIAPECDDINLLKTVALGTDSVLAATDIALKDELGAQRLVSVTPSELQDTTSRLGVVRLSNRSPSPIAQTIIDGLRQRLLAEAGRS